MALGRAKRHIPMMMQDWAERIDKFLLSDDRDILKSAGKISIDIAKGARRNRVGKVSDCTG